MALLSGITNGGPSNLIVFVQDTINLVISLSALIAVMALVKQGIQYMLSLGDPEKAEQAQKGIVYAIVGLVLVFIAPMIIKFVLDEFLS